MNIVPGEPLPPRPLVDEIADEYVAGETAPEAPARRARGKLSLGRALSFLLMIALASGPAAVQAFREGEGAPSDLLACDATIGALTADGSALDMMLTRWGEAADEAISSRVAPARDAMAREDVDGFVEVINQVVNRCHDVSPEFTGHFDAFCEASPASCRDRVRLF